MKRGEKGYWLNTEKRIWKHIVKPCKLCGFCPYGQLIEEFPLHPDAPEGADLNELAIEGKLDTKYSCRVFGHDCPVFYHAEPLYEDNDLTQEDIDAMDKELGD
jgi:hypothetical protein